MDNYICENHKDFHTILTHKYLVMISIHQCLNKNRDELTVLPNATCKEKHEKALVMVKN